MKPLFCCLALFGSLQIAHAKTVKTEQFVRYCNAIYRQGAVFVEHANYSSHTVFPRYDVVLKERRYMASLSFRQLREKTQRAARLLLSRSAAVSVAYVSAMNGIRPYHNARLMLNYVEPARPLWNNLDEMAEDVYYRMRDIYKRFPDRRTALLLLEEQGSDGAGAEVATSARFSILAYQPRFVFSVAMQSKQAFSRIARDFSRGEPEEGDFRVLRRLCHDSDPIVRRGARQIRHLVHADYSANHKPHPRT